MNTTFETFNEEIMAELTLARAAEMEDWLSSLELNPEIDTAFLSYMDEPDLLTEEDLKSAQEFERLGQKTSNDILLRAAQTVRMMEDMDEEKDVNTIADCGEWLQLNKTAIRNSMKRSLPVMKDAGYDLDDLIQEANLAVLTAWDNFDPDSGVAQDSFCWHSIFYHIMTLRRAARTQKRGYGLTESMNAVVLAHFDPEDIWDGSNVSRLSNKPIDCGLDDIAAMREELNVALNIIQNENWEVLSMLAAGYTQAEIAEAIGCSQSSVSYRLSAERKNLKAEIA